MIWRISWWPVCSSLSIALTGFMPTTPTLAMWEHWLVGAWEFPLVFTGHSLGREKLRRLLAGGGDHDQIEQAFSISRRIDAEELALAHADLVITSTRQEADEQYSRYGRFQADRAQVVPLAWMPAVSIPRVPRRKPRKLMGC